MHERYEYRTIRIERGAWPPVAAAVSALDLAEAGGALFGLWRGEIGWWNDEGAVMTSWTSAPVHELLDGLPGVLDSTVERVEATVRPVEPEPPTTDGVYAHRWFEVAADDVDEFIELSTGAWPDFERAHDGTEVIGLFRGIDDPGRLLLLTRYASLAMWEQSRPYNPNPSEGTDAARAKFMRRAELTRRTGVRLSRLVRPA
jgi:hypothetical protein